MKSDIKKLLKEYYEHMCGVDDYGCDGCLKYEKLINEYIDKKTISKNIIKAILKDYFDKDNTIFQSGKNQEEVVEELGSNIFKQQVK